MNRRASFAIVAVSIGCACLVFAQQQSTSSTGAAMPQGRAQNAPDRTRVNVRHALDPDASTIERAPKDTTWADLLAVKHPDDVTTEAAQLMRFTPFETTTWRIKGTLKSIILRPDHDFFMNITDEHGGTGVVEVPDPTLCADSPLHALIAAARDALDRKYHPMSTMQNVGDPITVVGVGFFGWENPGTPGYGSTSRLMPGIGVDFGG